MAFDAHFFYVFGIFRTGEDLDVAREEVVENDFEFITKDGFARFKKNLRFIEPNRVIVLKGCIPSRQVVSELFFEITVQADLNLSI